MSSNTTLPAATVRLVRAVLALMRTPYDDPVHYEWAQGVLELCDVALKIVEAANAEEAGAAPVVQIERGDLGPRIAELTANGKGVRQIARILAVHPSTVSRRLRRVS
jgi:hypothetical protein